MILEENTPYELVAALPGVGHFHTVFTTASELFTTSISGSVSADLDIDAVSVDRSFIIITAEPPLDLLDPERPNDVGPLLKAAKSVVPMGRTYEATGLPNGTYYPYAHVLVEVGRDHFIVNGFVDVDEDNIPDGVEISDANPNPTADIIVQLPDPFLVLETSPASRATGVGGGETTIAVTFNRAIGEAASDAIAIHPEPVSHGDVEVNNATARIVAVLEDGTIYGVVVDGVEDSQGEPLASAYKFAFATGDIATGSITGRLFLPRDLPVQQRVIEKAAVVQLFRIVEGAPQERPSRTFPTRSGEFVIENIPDGEYAIAGFVEVGIPKGQRPGRANAATDRRGPNVSAELADRVNEGGFDKDEAHRRFEHRAVPAGYDHIEFFGYYDADEDGKPDIITIADGNAMEGADIFLRPLKRRRDEVLSVVAHSPEKGTTVETATELSLTFSAPLFTRGRHVAVDAVLVPRPQSGALSLNFELSDDAKTITWPVTLSENKRYRLIVAFAEGVGGKILVDPFELGLNTKVETEEDEEGEGYGNVSGTVTLSEGIIDDAEVVLHTRARGPRKQIDVVGVATVDVETGAYLIEDVHEGEYRLYMKMLTADGEELYRFHDGNGDGEPDPVTVADGVTTSGIDIAVQVVTIDADEVALTAEADSNRTVSLDLNTEAGNNRRNAVSDLSSGDNLAVAIYYQDVKDVTGFAFTLSYDPTQLEFLFVVPSTPDEKNFLVQNGGTTVFLPAQLGEKTVLYGGAILGATSETASAGDGLLGVAHFTVLDDFDGTVFSVVETIFKGLNYSHTITIPVSAAALPSLELLQQQKGPVSFDFDESAQDQAQLNRGFIDPGTEFTVAVYLNGITDLSGVTDLSNYGVTVQYEPDQVTYVGFTSLSAQETNFLVSGGGTVMSLPPLQGAASVEFGSAILGADANNAPDGQGLIGVLTFEANEGFTQSDLIITEYSLNTVGGEQQTFATTIIGRVAAGEVDLSIPAGEITQVEITGVAGDADFSGDGKVDLQDFFALADNFGAEALDNLSVYDLDLDGLIGFGDFFKFADAYTAGKAVAPTATDWVGELELLTAVDDSGMNVTALPQTDLRFDRYGVALRFDPRVMRLASTASDEGVLAIELGPGELLVSATPPGVLPDGSQLQFEWIDASGPPLATEITLAVERAAVRAEDREIYDLRPSTIRAVLPTAFRLDQNYPNPFNPATTIYYQLPVAGAVRLEIFDVLGQRARTLVNEVRPAGAYSISWRGRDDGGHSVASGIYFYRLEAGTFTNVRKLMLLK